MIPAGIIALGFFNLYGDVHWPPWFLLVLFGVGYLTYSAYKRWGTVEALTLGYTLGSCTVSTFFQFKSNISISEITFLKHLSAETFICLLVVLLIFQFYDAFDLKQVRYGLFAFLGLLLASMYIDLFRETKAIGLLGNKSIGCSFLVIMVFLVPLHWFLWVTLATLVVFKSGISFIALMLGWGIVESLRYKTPMSLLYATGLGALAIPLVETDWQRLLSIPRIEAWQMYLSHWWNHESIWFGIGPGAFQYWGPKIQILNQFQISEGYWIWAHSDWIQLLIEGGIIGLVIYLSFFFKICYNYYLQEDWNHLGATIAFGVVMLGNYPINIAMFSVLAFYLITQSYGGMEWGRMKS